MKQHEISGGFVGSGIYNNVILGGTPNNAMQNGMPLAQAHTKNWGYGLGSDGSPENMTLSLNLIGWATNDKGEYLLNQSYVHYGGTYNWNILIEGRKTGGAWQEVLYLKNVFVHDGSQDWDLSYKNTWERTARNSQWSRSNFNFSNFNQIRFTIRGDESTQVNPVIFELEDLVTSYKPTAVVVDGVIKSLDTKDGYIYTVVNGELVNIAEELYPEGEIDKGNSQIFLSGQMKKQGKIGE